MTDELPFKYVGGDPSLDLVNTVDWTGRGPENERLTDYTRLTRWAEGAGLVSKAEAERLRRAGAARPKEARAAHDAALRLRLVLQRLYSKRSDWREFNELLGKALRQLGVSPPRKGQMSAEWEWHGTESLESLLWPVTWSAAILLTSDEAQRIRVCASLDCGWMYVDRSRNGLRRWCQMETCGTLEKSRRRAEKRT
ncbi:MAG TPA: ABATE domain-containing protein [Thermoanaerobaculia bacterium]|nr:ABATE domain-containing protein [Thermoanaerobaculia bacterium]